MLLCFALALLRFNGVQADEQFAHFKTILRAKHKERIKPWIAHIGRQADPCRIAAISGRSGQNSVLNSAEKVLMKMKNDADNVRIRKLAPETKADACKEALKHCKNRDMNREICAEALAHYMKRKETTQRSVGRSSASAWDELYGELTESLTTDEIIEQLDLYNSASLGLLIDNTGSMADDIDQVTRITESFLETELYYDDIIYNFVIMTFGDPDYEQPTAYWEPTQAVNHVNSKIVASMGGDCPEMTCQAIEQMLLYSDMFSQSPIFVFTDASSKDCSEDLVTSVEDWAKDFSQTLNFVLTGICGDEVDGNFTRLAASTGGSIYRLEDEELYRMTDIVAEGTEGGSYLAYDDWDEDDWDEDEDWKRKKRDMSNELSAHFLLRRRRQADFSTFVFYVDETVGRLAMQVTFKNRADRRLLDGITMTPQENCNTHNQETGSRFGNIVHYAVHCPCVGVWKIKVPSSFDNPWTFSAKTFGDFSIGFDVGFEQAASNGNVERTKEPCAGDTAKMIITLTQRDSIDATSRIHVLLNGESYDEIFRLNTSDESKWYVEIRVPKIPFKVAVRGTTVAGNTFLRIQNTEIKPTTTCLKTEHIQPSAWTIKAGRVTTIIMSLENKYQMGEYKLFCFNDRQKDGFETKIERPRNRVHRVIDPDRLYYIFIKVRAPQVIEVGLVVNVWCVVRSDNDRAIKSYRLMTSLYD